jgi:hypothetical protein
MPKFLMEGSYSAEGLRGLVKRKVLERRAAAKDALAPLGGKLEGVCYAALALAAASSGLIGTRTIRPGFSALVQFVGRTNL